MAGFNLPPGCSVSDIPGNRPEDLAAEALYDKIYDILAPFGGSAVTESVADAIYKLCGEVYGGGYAQGQDDTMLAHQEALERSAGPIDDEIVF
jgi:hypothetical protein